MRKIGWPSVTWALSATRTSATVPPTRGASATTSASTWASSVDTSPRVRKACVPNAAAASAATAATTTRSRRLPPGRGEVGSLAGGASSGRTSWILLSGSSGGDMVRSLHFDVDLPGRITLDVEEEEQREGAQQHDPGEQEDLLEGDDHPLPGHGPGQRLQGGGPRRDRVVAALHEPGGQLGQPLLHLRPVGEQ